MALTPDLASLLGCPECAGPLGVAASEVSCPACRKSHPVVEGIPRFVPGELYASSFGFQWNRFEVQIPQEDEEVFRVKTGFSPEELKGKRVLDAGCGSGRYSAVAARWGARVAAMDMSRAVAKAEAVCGSLGASVLQADLNAPPFRPASFDFVFSIGVLHHTPDARKAFLAIARLLKPGGEMAAWVYRKNTLPQEALNTLARGVTTRLPQGVLLALCRILAFLGGIPLLNKALGRIVNLGSTHPDPRIRLCDAFDWYSAEYQSHHTPQEVAGWAREAGLVDVRLLPPQKTGRFYLWCYEHGLLIGSGVNIRARRP